MSVPEPNIEPVKVEAKNFPYIQATSAVASAYLRLQ